MKVLIVCNDKTQTISVMKGFPQTEDTRFILYGETLTGERFDKIIAFTPYGSGAELEFRSRELIEHLPTRLVVGGEFITI